MNMNKRTKNRVILGVAFVILVFAVWLGRSAYMAHQTSKLTPEQFEQKFN